MVFVEHSRQDRRRHDQQIRQSFILTTLGVWTVVLLFVWIVTPLLAPGVWPLLEIPKTASGRKAPETKADRWVSIRANGQIFLDEFPVSIPLLIAGLAQTSRDAHGDIVLPTIFVRVDRAAPFGAVRAVVRAAQKANRFNLVFMAAPVNLDAPAPWTDTCGSRYFYAIAPGITPPVVLRRVTPDFGDVQQKFRGSQAVVDMLIDDRGEICAIHPVTTLHPLLDERIIGALRQWKFAPALRNGQPVACVFTVSVLIDVR